MLKKPLLKKSLLGKTLSSVQSRENKAQETMIKLIETTVKYNKTSFGLQWASGNLWQL